MNGKTLFWFDMKDIRQSAERYRMECIRKADGAGAKCPDVDDDLFCPVCMLEWNAAVDAALDRPKKAGG